MALKRTLKVLYDEGTTLEELNLTLLQVRLPS